MIKQKENFAAQLRGLRLLLGQDNKPISGETFAERSGIALGTVRAIENGLRKLRDEDRRISPIISVLIGVPRKSAGLTHAIEKPHSRQLYEAHAQALNAKTTPKMREGTLIWQRSRAFYLLMKLPDKSYRLAILELHDRLQAIAETSDAPPEVFEVLKLCAPWLKPQMGVPGSTPRPEEPFSYMYSAFPKAYLQLRAARQTTRLYAHDRQIRTPQWLVLSNSNLAGRTKR